MPDATFHDRYGLPLTARSAQAVDRYIDGADRHLSRNGGARACFEAAVADDPGFAMAHAALALQSVADDSVAGGAAVAERLRALAAPANAWERCHIEIDCALVSGQALRASILQREQLAEYPRDVLALKSAMALLEVGGRADWPERRLDLLESVATAYGDAQPLAERTLAANPRSADAAHALAHVHYEMDEHSAGAAFLEAWLPGYQRSAPYHGHLSWHLALFELAQGRYARALHVYERDLRPTDAEGRGRLLDSASLLWRIRLADREPDGFDWTPVRRLADRWPTPAAREPSWPTPR